MISRVPTFPLDLPAFGAGPHFCAGAWASKALIAEVALPKIFARFTPRLSGDVRVGGWASGESHLGFDKTV